MTPKQPIELPSLDEARISLVVSLLTLASKNQSAISRTYLTSDQTEMTLTAFALPKLRAVVSVVEVPYRVGATSTQPTLENLIDCLQTLNRSAPTSQSFSATSPAGPCSIDRTSLKFVERLRNQPSSQALNASQPTTYQRLRASTISAT